MRIGSAPTEIGWRSGRHRCTARFRYSDLKEAPYFGRAIAYRVLNRNRVTYWGNVVTQLLIADIAVALPNSITRKRLPLCGFVVCWACSAA
jgi:hypothetical protein